MNNEKVFSNTVINWLACNMPTHMLKNMKISENRVIF